MPEKMRIAQRIMEYMLFRKKVFEDLQLLRSVGGKFALRSSDKNKNFHCFFTEQTRQCKPIASVISFSAKNEYCFSVKLFHPILYCIQRSARSIFRSEERRVG